MSAQHTPGPWRMWTSNSFRRISSDATGKDGDVLCAVRQASDGHPDLHFSNGGYEGPDAALILAAPELLEALEAFMALDKTFASTCDAHLEEIAKKNPLGVAVKLARAAIAKATGSTDTAGRAAIEGNRSELPMVRGGA